MCYSIIPQNSPIKNEKIYVFSFTKYSLLSNKKHIKWQIYSVFTKLCFVNFSPKNLSKKKKRKTNWFFHLKISKKCPSKLGKSLTDGRCLCWLISLESTYYYNIRLKKFQGVCFKYPRGVRKNKIRSLEKNNRNLFWSVFN